jgi:PE family
MTFRLVSGGLAVGSVDLEALTARLASAHAGAAPLMTVVGPPAVALVSLQSDAVGFSAQGGEHATMTAPDIEESGRSGVGAADSGNCCTAGDTSAASSYLIAGD